MKRRRALRWGRWALGVMLLALPALNPASIGLRGVQASAASSGNWPYFGGDRNNTRFSPLTQITAANVSKLGVAWTYNLGQFQVLAETYPQMVGRTLYVTTSSDEVIALNAVNGKEIWQYAPQVNFSLSTGIGGYGVSTNRGVAIANGMVYELTFDNQLKAVDGTTGEEIWSASVADPHYGYYETMAPTYWDGLIFVGASGSEDGVRGFVAAYDAKTGKQVWRFYTVPAPGHGWVPKGRHGGGGVYMPPTIDTRTGLLYVGTGTPSPVLLGTGRMGPNLYTDSILALQARTGKLVWYYQEVPHDQWNYGAASPVVIYDATIKGKTVHAVGEAGKDGHVYLLNAATGKPLFPPLAYVPVHHPAPTTKGVIACPGTVGGSPYSPMAYSPIAHAAYVAGVNICFKIKLSKAVTGGETDFAGTRSPATKHPSGTFSAVNVDTGKFLWKRTMPTPMIGGAAVTASNLVFTADQHGTL
jgi:alcohol dehydrogenase (cytochrome c)